MTSKLKTSDLTETAINDPHKADNIGVIKRVTVQVDVSQLSGSTSKASINPVQTEEFKLPSE